MVGVDVLGLISDLEMQSYGKRPAASETIRTMSQDRNRTFHVHALGAFSPLYLRVEDDFSCVRIHGDRDSHTPTITVGMWFFLLEMCIWGSGALVLWPGRLVRMPI